MQQRFLVSGEGWEWVGGAALGSLICAVWLDPWWSLPGWLACGWLIWVFRSPQDEIPIEHGILLSPVGGHIQAIEKSRQDEREVWHIRIRMGWRNRLWVYMPEEGRLVERRQHPMERRRNPIERRHNPADLPGIARITGHRGWMELETDSGESVMLLISPSRWFSRFCCYLHIGERVGRGQRCGRCYFTCLADMYLPAHARLRVKPGQAVRGGATILADLPHAAPAANTTPEPGVPA
jgi:phosphatidylserine decarboxylase